MPIGMWESRSDFEWWFAPAVLLLLPPNDLE